MMYCYSITSSTTLADIDERFIQQEPLSSLSDVNGLLIAVTFTVPVSVHVPIPLPLLGMVRPRGLKTERLFRSLTDDFKLQTPTSLESRVRRLYYFYFWEEANSGRARNIDDGIELS